jgi:hypothetical protein
VKGASARRQASSAKRQALNAQSASGVRYRAIPIANRQSSISLVLNIENRKNIFPLFANRISLPFPPKKRGQN